MNRMCSAVYDSNCEMIGVNSILLHRSSNLLRVELDESAESDAEAEISKLYDVVILIIYTNIINIFGESIFFSTSGFYGGTTCRLGKEADLFPRIGKADSDETNVENVPNRKAVLNVLLQSPLWQGA